MPIAGYTTTLTVAKSYDAVTKLLLRAKAKTVSAHYDDHGLLVGVWFTVPTEFGDRDYQLPVRIDGVRATLRRDKVEPRYQTPEHAARVAWRIAHDWLRAQLALIDAGMTTLPEVMLPYALVGAGTTLWDSWVERQGAIER